METLEKLVPQGDSAAVDALSSKICCFDIVQLLYARLDTKDLNTTSSTINDAYYDSVVAGRAAKSGKELTQGLVKLCHATKSQVFVRSFFASFSSSRSFVVLASARPGDRAPAARVLLRIV